MLTTDDIQRLVKLKAKDRDAFYRLLDELKSAHPFDILLSHARFKEYAPNVNIVRPRARAASKAVRSKP